MSGVLRGRGGPVCWNCDRRRDETTVVTIRAPSGGTALLALCRPCYASVYLPLAADAAELALEKPPERTVLVVDDDPGTRELLVAIFRGEGFGVDAAANGVEALRKTRDRVPDAIVLDLVMPVMDGRDFLTAWHRTTPPPAIPVVAISAHGARVSAEELGATAFLPKPFDIEVLVGTVDRLLAPAPSPHGAGAT